MMAFPRRSQHWAQAKQAHDDILVPLGAEQLLDVGSIVYELEASSQVSSLSQRKPDPVETSEKPSCELW